MVHQITLGLLALGSVILASSASTDHIQNKNATSNTIPPDGNPAQYLECTPKPPTGPDTRPLLGWCRITVEVYPFPKSDEVGVFHISGRIDDFKLPYTARIEDEGSGGCLVRVDIPFHVADSCTWHEVWLAAKHLIETCRESSAPHPRTGGYTMIGESGYIRVSVEKDSDESFRVEEQGMNGSAYQQMT